MSVDQTFHTPSFGDEEFEVPSLSYAPTAASIRCSGQGFYGNQILAYHRDPIAFNPQPQQHLLYHQQNCSNQYPQLQNIMSNGHQQYHGQSPQQQHPAVSLSSGQNMYQDNMVPHSTIHMQMPSYNDGRCVYTDAPMHQGNMQPSQMHLMQHHQPMGPPQQQLQQQAMFSTISHSQMSNQLGLQIGMGASPVNQGPPSSNGSPPGSNHNSPGRETSEDSDDSVPLSQLIGGMKRPSAEPLGVVSPKATKKPKAQKKKKKRDPNEPQKPVSAYALFFRDTQAAIKGQNPNASFGEVSKIVASMWDSLEVDTKNVYKKKTETAKKEYLKALAAYRATLVSKAAVDQSDAMYNPNQINSASPPISSPTVNSPPGVMMSPMQNRSPVLTSVVDSMQPVTTMAGHSPMVNQQAWHVQSPPHMMTSNSPPQHMLQANNNNNMVNMQAMNQQQNQMPPQMNMQSPPQHMNSVPQSMCQQSSSNSPPYPQQNMTQVQSPQNNVFGVEMMGGASVCVRSGCSNPAVDSPLWDKEYCSSECVVSHCRDVFTAWVAARQTNTAYSAVK